MKVNRLTSWFAGMIFAMSLIAVPLATNADYATCKQSCKNDGYSDSVCSNACSQ